jgi:hypothetical protein
MLVPKFLRTQTRRRLKMKQSDNIKVVSGEIGCELYWIDLDETTLPFPLPLIFHNHLSAVQKCWLLLASHRLTTWRKSCKVTCDLALTQGKIFWFVKLAFAEEVLLEWVAVDCVFSKHMLSWLTETCVCQYAREMGNNIYTLHNSYTVGLNNMEKCEPATSIRFDSTCK